MSCTAPGACTAVGTRRSCEIPSCLRYATALAERWDGTTWTSQPLPPPQRTGVRAPLLSVSCASATRCAATGNIVANGHAVLTWDGSAWTQHDIPRPGVDFYNADVACAGTNCQVVGGYYPPVGRAQVLVRTFTVDSGGAVHFVPVAVSEPPGPADYTLTDVSCTSSTSCVAVGVLRTDPAKRAVYLARWDGVTWTDETVSVASATGNATGRIESPSVSCSAPGQCMIVGVQTFDDKPFMEPAFSVQIDGDTRTVRSLGTSMIADHADVSCTASNECTAALDVVDCGRPDGCGHLPDFERWDGRTWQQQTPDAQLDQDSPDGSVAVSCGSATGCVAIGHHDAQVWNGSTWHVENLPAPDDSEHARWTCPARRRAPA